MRDERTLDPGAIERVFGRYRSLVSSYDAFTDALLAPLPAVVWAHPTRTTRDELAAHLAADGVVSEPVPWEPSALRLPGTERPGLHWTYAAGLYHVQEEASLVPVRLLDPRPGERVLDLCAAPGGKTARIAFALNNRGTVVANDRSAARLAATSAAIGRLGIRNVTCTVTDGMAYPLGAGRFDKVLVDAPCTAEGTMHKSSPWRREPHDFRRWIPGVQRALLERGLRLCRPGGRVVYSTCTLAPEENEAVIDAVIAAAAGRARVAPVAPIEGLPLSPGLDAWEGQRFAPEVQHAVRLWPHLGRTSAFFVAVIEKDADAPDEPTPDESRPIDALAIEAGAHPTLARFQEAFGLAEDELDRHRVLEWGRYARLVPDDHRMPAHARHVSTGLTVTRNRVRGPKLSTGGGMSLGRTASRQVVQLDPSAVARFHAREPVPLDEVELVDCAHDGYVVVRTGPHALGLGRVVRGDGRDELVSEFPKAWTI
ncbi:MAG: RsmB/NOP family class I SAM-dependent RNA methyltransferase [Sandaracinaceae bacterium]|nr:RsmB/NOP family class I SAM-dependent RNA methyltransferase [Sandaracinaceae bacterium]